MTDVSVLTPSLSYGRFIADCIESVARQGDLRVQHVVQDGGSEDETLDLLRSSGSGVEWKSEQDAGQSDALNRALKRANGSWVAWLNADEYYLPGALETLVEEGERSGADVLYGDTITVDREGRMLDLHPQHPFSAAVLRLYGPFLASASVVIRRSILGPAPWDLSLKVIMDWDLYLGVQSKGASFHHVPRPVAAFRIHEDQMSARPGEGATTRVRERYGIPTDRWRRIGGTALHRSMKLLAGSYVRQLRARTLRGHDTRWFREEVGIEPFQSLLDRCYGGHRDAGG